MANEPEQPATDKPLHCAEIVDAPNRHGIKSTVHLCVRIDHERGDVLDGVVVNLDVWSLSLALRDLLQRDHRAKAALEEEVGRAATVEFLRQGRVPRWAGSRLD
jgi:hypothetical protein